MSEPHPLSGMLAGILPSEATYIELENLSDGRQTLLIKTKTGSLVKLYGRARVHIELPTGLTGAHLSVDFTCDVARSEADSG